MCPPLIAVAGLAVSAASSVMGGMMQQSQAKAQAAAYDRQALLTRQQGQYEADRKQAEIDKITGQQIAGTASSGLTFDGSPTDAITSTVSNGALDTAAIRRSARIQSDDLTYQGQISRINGRNAMTGGVIGAAGGLLGGLGKLGNPFGRQ